MTFYPFSRFCCLFQNCHIVPPLPNLTYSFCILTHPWEFDQNIDVQIAALSVVERGWATAFWAKQSGKMTWHFEKRTKDDNFT